MIQSVFYCKLAPQIIQLYPCCQWPLSLNVCLGSCPLFTQAYLCWQPVGHRLPGCECATITCVYQRRGQNVAAQALLAGQWREAGPSVVNTCLLKVTMYRGASTNLRGVILGSVSHVQNTFVYIDKNHFL